MEWIVGGLFVVVAVVAAGVWAWQRSSAPGIEAEPGLTAAALMDEMSPRKKKRGTPEKIADPAPTPTAAAHTSGWVGDIAGDDREAVLGAPPKKDR